VDVDQVEVRDGGAYEDRCGEVAVVEPVDEFVRSYGL
jgi:hypothetical protein